MKLIILSSSGLVALLVFRENKLIKQLDLHIGSHGINQFLIKIIQIQFQPKRVFVKPIIPGIYIFRHQYLNHGSVGLPPWKYTVTCPPYRPLGVSLSARGCIMMTMTEPKITFFQLNIPFQTFKFRHSII